MMHAHVSAQIYLECTTIDDHRLTLLPVVFSIMIWAKTLLATFRPQPCRSPVGSSRHIGVEKQDANGHHPRSCGCAWWRNNDVRDRSSEFTLCRDRGSDSQFHCRR